MFANYNDGFQSTTSDILGFCNRILPKWSLRVTELFEPIDRIL